MDNLPLWIRGLALAIALPLTVEAGYRLYPLLDRSKSRDVDKAAGDGWGYLVSASLTLLALLLSFSVSLAVDRYELRRELLVEEANDISTVYLRSQLFDEPAASQLRAQVAQYARDRQDVFLAGDVRTRIQQAQALAESDQDRLWATMARAVRQPGSEPITAQFLVSMNAMIDVAATRHAALDANMPRRVILVLLVNALAAALATGYTLAHGGNRYLIMSTLVSLTVAMTLFLIIDLDSPRSGGIEVPEAPLDRVIASISQAEKARRTAGVEAPRSPAATRPAG